MSEAGVLVVKSGQDFWDEKQIAALRQIGLSDVPNGDLAVFLHYCQRTGLDPFARQIYMIGRKDNRNNTTKYTIQASIDGLRIVAERSGRYGGQAKTLWCGEDGVWKDVWLDKKPPVAAMAGVFVMGFDHPTYAVAKFESYAVVYNGEPSGLWKKMPDVMIAKCAEALALRKAFPQDLSGVYSSEEMHQIDNDVKVIGAGTGSTGGTVSGIGGIGEVIAVRMSDERVNEIVDAVEDAVGYLELIKAVNNEEELDALKPTLAKAKVALSQTSLVEVYQAFNNKIQELAAAKAS